jgi:DNA-binding transcriptional ArsR family regulator
MRTARLRAEDLDRLADRFKALAEPNRLAILSTLHARELSVGALVDATGLGQANVSKHLDILRRHGFVERRKDGLNAFYRLADRDVFRICDVMCGRPERIRAAPRRRDDGAVAGS